MFLIIKTLPAVELYPRKPLFICMSALCLVFVCATATGSQSVLQSDLSWINRTILLLPLASSFEITLFMGSTPTLQAIPTLLLMLLVGVQCYLATFSFFYISRAVTFVFPPSHRSLSFRIFARPFSLVRPHLLFMRLLPRCSAH